MSTEYRAGRLGVDHPGRCRFLRRQLSDAERALWRWLRDRQLGGAKFRRQHEFGPYVLDFYCREHCLVVEVDGGQHYEPEQAARDELRTVYLQTQGLRVLRFSNRDVLLNLEGVLEVVWAAVGGEPDWPSPQPTPSGEREPDGPSPQPSPSGEREPDGPSPQPSSRGEGAERAPHL